MEPKMNLPRDIQRERLYYIEFLALFAGQVSRKDLTGRFGISEPAATKDLSLYSELAPSMLRYDLRRKCYVFDGGKPYFKHNVEQALHALAGIGAVDYDPSRTKRLPGWVSSSIRRELALDLVSTLTRSIEQHQYVIAEYTSLSSGSRKRKLSPLAVVNDGLRWHIRCFDHDRKEFLDYALTRFESAEVGGASDIGLADDKEWSTEVTLKLVPHPKADHPEATCVDFDMLDGAKLVTLNACLVGYFLRHWHVDYSVDASGSPRAQQLFLANRIELQRSGVPSWALKID
ncbi:WYL domain-containing protein [Caballeronia sp. SEWSISQ10-4 2]|uniref:WYL domain-containing protein n=1 Tax=Caballeronia sp. SEWSISQ10-4 2 TaxID=2937438 RepID=UPI002650A6A7|nr:WYL domain-containing protein [Caballeronia sp. SEWSISQ10-4 2]MDN7182639.1 WYL domain-containing protein [Caballeronia sp. SEWSISQ10-4 2]